MRLLRSTARKPITWLLLIAGIAGLLTFRDYGLTWDEPLFYAYGDALGYAYTPANWFSGHFDLNLSYGPSATDHKTRGPGYLLLAREPAKLLQALHVDAPSAWHVVNFFTFLAGVYFVYRLSLRVASERGAVASSALFATQPMLWGHGFINPKDMPFMVFMAGAVWLGFDMVDTVTERPQVGGRSGAARTLLAGAFLGLATAMRVLGPLAAILVLLYFAAQRPGGRKLGWIALYAVAGILVTIAAWPYLWEDPGRLVSVSALMADNPTVLPVLFAGNVYRAFDLPRRYLPFFLGTTLTEPVWPLAALGLFSVPVLGRLRSMRTVQISLFLLWFLGPVAYAVLARPPMYDGMRHFLFVLPPVFCLLAPGIDLLLGWLRGPLWAAILPLILVVPGIVGLVTLHPYEYTYFNSMVKGTGGAFRHYETDYWLTCYKEAVENFSAAVTTPVRLFVHREAEVAAPYAASNVQVLDERGARSSIGSGDYILVNTRTNEDRQTFHDAPEVFSVARAGATFCVVKRIP
jgi:hypothetical protein